MSVMYSWDGYQDLIPALTGLPDPDDRHVLAAAIVGRADTIVTFNVRDFPASALEPYGVQAQHPDTFVRHFIEVNESSVIDVLREMRAALKNPPMTAEELLISLSKNGLTQSVAALRDRARFSGT